jgi:hypothetical protein
VETNPFRTPRPERHHGSAGEPKTAPGSPLRRWIAEGVAGRRWVWRAPVLLVLAWIGWGYLADPAATSIFSGITLAFHEMGHAAFSWLGNRILTTAGGTIFQVGVPVAAGAYLAVKQRDPFGAAVCAFWLGTALVEAGVYAADARAQALQLVSPFGSVDVDSHDWTVMLMKFGKLSKDQEIGAFLVGAGRVAIVGSLLAGAWVLRIMATTRSPGSSEAGWPSPRPGPTSRK